MITPSEVRSLFDRVAPAYDPLNRILSLGRDVLWRRAAARLLNPPVPGPILDLACGTLDLSLELAAVHPGRRIIGADFSLEMIRAGRPKLDRPHPGRVAVMAGDGMRLPLADSSTSGATIAFGIRNMPDRDAALAELARVIKPGGRLAILEFGVPGGVFRTIYLTYLTRLLPIFARLLSPDPAAYVYLARSIIEFPDTARFLEMMDRAGFASRVLPLNRGICNLYLGSRR